MSQYPPPNYPPPNYPPQGMPPQGYPPNQYPPPGFQQPPAKSAGTGMATAAMILGLIGLIVPILGLVAVILGIVALVSRTPAKGKAITGIVAGVVGMLLLPVIIFALVMPNVRMQANRLKSSTNMRQIATAALIYAQDSRDGAYPKDLATLAASQHLSPSLFIAPATDDVEATNVKLLKNDSANCSYVYVYPKAYNGKSVPGDFVILYEPLDTNGGKGANFAHADGSVEWLEAARAEKVIEQVNSGKNPPKDAR